MSSITIARSVVNHTSGTKHTEVIVHAAHKNVKVLSKLYDLLLANDSLEGGDKIVYITNSKVTKQYTLCMVCCKRAIEGLNKVKCATCAKKHPSYNVQREQPSLKPKVDYSQFYKY